MKIKLFGVMAISVLLMAVGACATGVQADQNSYVNVSAQEFFDSQHVSKQVEVDRGASLIIVLGSNPSTGFIWNETAQLGDATMLQQTGHKYVASESTEQPLIGAPSQEQWTFNALKAGVTKIGFQYSQPWAGGTQAEWTFELTVTVK